MKKGDISINMILVILITVISITMLIGIFMARLPGFSKGIYCKTFFYVHSATWVPKGLRVDQDYCMENKLLEPPIILSDDVPLNVSILGHMIACWKESSYGALNEPLLCYQLVLGPRVPVPQEITEIEITQMLIEEKLCRRFGNNDVTVDIDGVPETCGDSDDINWSIIDDEFYEEQNILIEFIEGQVMVS